MIENTFEEYNLEMQRQAKFKQSVCFGHIIENPGINTNQLAKLMYCNMQTVNHYLKHLDQFLKVEKESVDGRITRVFYPKKLNQYDWGTVYKRTDDPRRKYFEDKYKDLPEHLKEAIFTGKIDASIVRVFNEGDLDHCYVTPKRKSLKVHIGTTMDLI